MEMKEKNCHFEISYHRVILTLVMLQTNNKMLFHGKYFNKRTTGFSLKDFDGIFSEVFEQHVIFILALTQNTSGYIQRVKKKMRLKYQKCQNENDISHGECQFN